MWGGCVSWGGSGVCMGGWVSEFETNGIVYLLIHTISMSMVCLDEFGKIVD